MVFYSNKMQCDLCGIASESFYHFALTKFYEREKQRETRTSDCSLNRTFVYYSSYCEQCVGD